MIFTNIHHMQLYPALFWFLLFRKEVLEQKVNLLLNSLGFTRPIKYKVRLDEHVKLETFLIFSFCTAGRMVPLSMMFCLFWSNLVTRKINWIFILFARLDLRKQEWWLLKMQGKECLTSFGIHFWLFFRSRLAGEKPKDVSNKLDFSSFVEHYKAYPTAQALYNKMVKLL